VSVSLISVNKSSSFSRNGDGGVVMLLLLKLRRLKSLRVPSSFTIICWDESGETPPNENSFVESGRARIKSGPEVSDSDASDPNGVASGLANNDG